MFQVHWERPGRDPCAPLLHTSTVACRTHWDRRSRSRVWASESSGGRLGLCQAGGEGTGSSGAAWREGAWDSARLEELEG